MLNGRLDSVTTEMIPTGFRDDTDKEKNKQKRRNDAKKSGERGEDFHRQLNFAVVRHWTI